MAALVEYNPFVAMLEADTPKPRTVGDIVASIVGATAGFALIAFLVFAVAYMPYRVVKEFLRWVL
jgi:hypothetical protein